MGRLLLPHYPPGVALVECGPASALDGLQAGLAKLGYSFRDVTDVLVTHVRPGSRRGFRLSCQGDTRIHVHSLGAPHLANPEKLLCSASRIYGDRMDYLWGPVFPVPEERLSVLQDGQGVPDWRPVYPRHRHPRAREPSHDLPIRRGVFQW